MSKRAALRLAALVGSDLLQIEDVGNGWPTTGVLTTDEDPLPVAMFVSTVGLGGRGRDDSERRFQNPPATQSEHDTHGWRGRPLTAPAGRTPLLIGVWESDRHLEVVRPVIVLADAAKREGLDTRHSVFIRPGALLEAATTGFAESTNDDGEVMPCIHPRLLPAVALAVEAGVDLPSREVEIAVEAAGLGDDATAESEAAHRARRTVSALVRDRRFRRWVVEAYGGRCAMCGIGIGRLIEAAHANPAGADDGADRVWNGICLCANHHSVFDAHLVFIDPADLSIQMHPAILEKAQTDPAAQAFVDSTWANLEMPLQPEARLRPEMLAARYSHFEGYYDWA